LDPKQNNGRNDTPDYVKRFLNVVYSLVIALGGLPSVGDSARRGYALYALMSGLSAPEAEKLVKNFAYAGQRTESVTENVADWHGLFRRLHQRQHAPQQGQLFGDEVQLLSPVRLPRRMEKELEEIIKGKQLSATSSPKIKARVVDPEPEDRVLYAPCSLCLKLLMNTTTGECENCHRLLSSSD
jgi:hypothetical protein